MSLFEKIFQLEKEADQYGFKWENPYQIIDQIKSECEEIKEHLNPAHSDQKKLQEEIGDLLHAAFSLCIFCHFDPKDTLDKSVDKFAHRFEKIKKIAQAKGLTNLQGFSFEELMKLWEEAKK